MMEMRTSPPEMPVEEFGVGRVRGWQGDVGEEDVDSLGLMEGLHEVERFAVAGCVEAEESLVRFVKGKTFEMFGDAEARRDGVLLEDQGTSSRLSPCIRFGELSPRLIFHAIVNAGAERGEDELAAARAFLKNICLRDFGYYTLYRNPHAESRPIVPEYHAFPWASDEDGKICRAWRTGTTGYPIVDAAMRQLAQEGWIHNRLRFLVAAFYCKYLLLPWHVGAAYLVHTLVDGDEACNSLGWQWIAGCHSDAIPSSYIVNPSGTESNGVRSMHDAAAYVRMYVPELAHLPDSQIFEPWGLDAKQGVGAVADPLDASSALVVSAAVCPKIYPARIVLGKDVRPRARNAIDVMRRIFHSQNVQRCIIEDMDAPPPVQRRQIEDSSPLAREESMELDLKRQAAAAAADFEARRSDHTHADAVDALSLLSIPSSASQPLLSGAKRPRTGTTFSAPPEKRPCNAPLSVVSGVTFEILSTLRRPPATTTRSLEKLSRGPTALPKRHRSREPTDTRPAVGRPQTFSQARGPISINSLLSAEPAKSLSPPSPKLAQGHLSRQRPERRDRREAVGRPAASLPTTPPLPTATQLLQQHQHQLPAGSASQPATPLLSGPNMAAHYPYSPSSQQVNFHSPTMGLGIAPSPPLDVRQQQPQVPEAQQTVAALHYSGGPSPGLHPHGFPVAYGGAPMNHPFGMQAMGQYGPPGHPYRQPDQQHQERIPGLPIAQPNALQYMEQHRGGPMPYGNGSAQFPPGPYPMQVVPPPGYMMGMQGIQPMHAFPPYMAMPAAPMAKDAGVGNSQAVVPGGGAGVIPVSGDKSPWVGGVGAAGAGGSSVEHAPTRSAVVRPTNCVERRDIARRMAAMDYEDQEVNGKHREQWQVIALHLLKEYEFTDATDRRTSKDYVRLCVLKDELRDGSRVWITVNHIKEVFRILNVPVTGEYDRRGHGGVRGPYVYGTRSKRTTDAGG